MLLLNSCVVPYDAETRLQFESKFVDSNENALNGVDIEIKISNGFGIGSGNEIISFGRTNGNGEISLVFPSPVFDENYKIFIRSRENENLGYVPFEIGNLDLDNFPNYKLSMNKIYRLTFDESVQVSLEFNPLNGNRKFLDLKIDGVFSPYNSTFLDDETYFSNFIYAKKNQTINLTYRVKNVSNGIIDTISQDIIVGTESIQTTINY